MRWDPFEELQITTTPSEAGFVPDCDIRETQDSYRIAVDLPGVHDQQVEISAVGNRISISGQRELEAADGDGWLRCERPAGQFTRSFTLPADADPDQVNAEMRDGVLRLTVPKRPESRARRIQIGGQAQKTQSPQQQKS